MRPGISFCQDVCCLLAAVCISVVPSLTACALYQRVIEAPITDYKCERLTRELGIALFTRWVDPASLELAHDTGYVTTYYHVSGDYCDVGLYVEGASRLKALFCEIGYEEEEWHPIQAEPSYVLGPPEKLLHYEIFSQPGKVVMAQALINPGKAQGFSGNGTLAMLRFERGGAMPVRSIVSPGPDDPPVSPLEFVRNASAESSAAEITFTQDMFRLPGDNNRDDKVSMADLVPIARQYSNIDANSLNEIALLTSNYGRNIKGFFIGRINSINELPLETSHVNGRNAEPWQFIYLEDLPKTEQPWRITRSIPLFTDGRRTVVYVRAMNLDGYGGAISREAVNTAKAK